MCVCVCVCVKPPSMDAGCWELSSTPLQEENVPQTLSHLSSPRELIFLICKNATLKDFDMTTVTMNPKLLFIVYGVHQLHTPATYSRNNLCFCGSPFLDEQTSARNSHTSNGRSCPRPFLLTQSHLGPMKSLHSF